MPLASLTPHQELDFLGCRTRVLADGDGTAGRFCLLDMLDVPAGHMPPLHVHHADDEGFYILEGEVTLHLPGERIVCGPGDFVLAPRGIPHAYEVGDRPARWLVLGSPAGFERFVADVAGEADADPARLAEIAAAHEIEILGPPGMLP